MAIKLKELYITPEYFQYLTGLEHKHVTLAWKVRVVLDYLFLKILTFKNEYGERGFWIGLTIASCVFTTFLAIKGWLFFVTVLAVGGIGGWIYLRKKFPKALISLFKEVENYNSVVKAVEIKEQLEAVHSKIRTLNTDQKQALEALKLTRTDLVNALKTERILRDNHQFITTNLEMFGEHLSTLQAMKVSEDAVEYTQFIDEMLNVSIKVRDEMSKLQNKANIKN